MPGEPGAPEVHAIQGVVAPEKALRLASALRATVDELHRVDLDDTDRSRLAESYQAALVEVASTVADSLIDELGRLGAGPLPDDAAAEELRIAHAQLLGWVTGAINSLALGGEPDSG
jgi:hypothetical protein